MFKTNRSMSLIAAIAAAAAITAAVPVQAKAKPDQQAHKFTVKKKDGRTLYCVKVDPVVGSRVRDEICRNRAEWAQDGINIPLTNSTADRDAQAQPSG